MKRWVIVAGADIGDYDRIRSFLREDDFFVFCDSGLKHRERLGTKPQLIVGDFDSFEKPQTQTETIVLPCEKDDTDTMYAVKEGVRRGAEEFLILGAVGGRLDHTLGNVAILEYLDALGKKGCIADDYSLITIVSDKADIDDSFSYFSLLGICGVAKGITVVNAKYPLNDAEITCEYPYGISNEVIKGTTAKVKIREGRLLLVKVF